MSAETRGRRRGLRTAAKSLVMVLALGLAAMLLYRTFRSYDAREILASLAAIPPSRLALVGLFAAASYLCLTGFDALGVRYAGASVPYRRVALASMTSLAIGHSIGFAALSSGAVRYRFYSRFGLGAEQIAKVILLCAATVGLALSALVGLGLLLRPGIAGQISGLGPGALAVVGGLGAVVPVAYVTLAAVVRGNLRIHGWSLKMPAPPIALAQIAIGSLNLLMVVGCLFMALPASPSIGYLDVLAVYTLANLAGLLTHVPGGLGVIEAVVIYLLPGADVIGALIVFRVAYFLVPFLLGLATLAAVELTARRRRTSQDVALEGAFVRLRR